MKGLFEDLMNFVKDELAGEQESEGQGDEEELPCLHRSLNVPGFAKLSPETTALVAKDLPKIDPELPWDIETSKKPAYQGKRFARDPMLGAYADLYKRLVGVDPDSAATFKYDGVLVADAAKTADSENRRISEGLASFLPAYVLKQNYDDETFGFEVTTEDALFALLNNHVYDTFKDFGYRDPEETAQESFINLLLGFTSRINIVFPTLNGLVHLGDCGQLFIGAADVESLAALEGLLKSAGQFVDIV